MRNCRQALKYCAVIALAILLVGAALYLPVPGGKTGTGTGMRPWQHGSSAGEPGVLMVLQLPGPGAPGQQGRGAVWADLSRMGVEQGDPLDSGHILVRVPSGKLQAAQAAAGSNLAEYQPSARLSPDLAAAPAENNPEAMLSLNVTVFESGDKEAVARSVLGLGGGVLWGEVQDGRVLQIRLPRGRLEDLAQLPEVVYIEPVRTYSLLNDRARDIVGATPLEALGWLAPESSLTGSGQIVGLADSGLDRGSVDEIHPDLASPPGGVIKVVALKSLAGAATAADTNGHGTHMAATIAGTGAASGGQYQGLAPGASLYFQGLTNPEGQLEPPPDLADLFGPAYEAGVRIHVDGWGDDASGYFSSASQTDGFIRAHPDFLVIFSAGNGGPGPGTLTSEAYTKNGLVVGASQSPHPMFDSEQVDSSSPSDFSSRGPTGDGRLKPELLAPGALISAKASQVTSEFDLGNYYTYMEGTSMAAAVAGGSAALLREYFQRFEQVASPSAALLKASLINGASTPASGPTKDGFGILDLGGTILALHEKTFQYIDSSKGVANDGTSTYTFQVQGGDSPLKATLAWTDPAAAPGSAHPLVNNLDLEVRDPSGKLWLGNSFLSPGQADDVNNVEQAFIPQPVAGSYTIYVKGTSIVQNTVPGASQNSQDFALVFGQPLVRDIVVSSSGSLALKSGRDVQLDLARVSYEQDGETVAWPVAATAGVGAASSGTAGSVEPSVGDPLCGADIYLPPDMEANNPAYAYLAGRTWQVQGVQVVDTGSGLIYTEIDPASRTGGFFLAPGASGRFWVNGRQLQQLASMPPGVEIRASINPGTQTIWEADADYQQVENYLGRVDQAQGELWLLGQQKPLSLTPQAELAYLDELTAIDTADLPFGASTVPAWDKLLPGLKLKLMVAPDSGEVMYVGAQRQLAVGKIAAVDPDAETVVLNSGKSSYIVGQGVTLQLDGQAAQLRDLQPGQLVMAVLVPGSRQVLSLAAYSQVLYGRVVYVSDKEQLLYLVDSMNNFHVVNLSAGTQVFRWGLPSGLNFIAPGAWVRLCLDPGTGQAQRLDVRGVGSGSHGDLQQL